MSKIVLNDVTNLNALAVINDNFDKIEQELQNKVLYRNNPNGEPNSLETSVDANDKDIFNVRNLSAKNFTVNGKNVEEVVDAAIEGVQQSAESAANSAAAAAAIADSLNPSSFVDLTSTQTISGVKSFSNPINGSITGNSATVTNGVTLNDTQTLTNKTINSAILNDGYTEEVFAIADGSTVNLDPNNGSIQTWTLGANRTPGQANWAAGQSITLMVDDGAARTITWTTLGVVWKTGGGTAPTLQATGFTVIALWKVGTTIYGARVGDA
jgi:hypothetical protein